MSTIPSNLITPSTPANTGQTPPTGQVSTYGAGGAFTGYAAPPSTTSPSSSTPAVKPTTSTPTVPATTPPPVTPTAPVSTPTSVPVSTTGTGTSGQGQSQAQANNVQNNYGISTTPAPTTYYTSSGQAYTIGDNGQVVYSSPSGTASTGNANEDALNASYAAQAAAANTFSTAVTNIENGTTPLNPGEQSQIDGLKAQFQNLIDTQTLENTGAAGTANVRGYQSGAAEYDPTFQAKTIGSVMSAGATKIATLQTQEASAVASLTQSLQNNDIANLKTAWDALTAAQKATQDGLKNAISDTQEAINDSHIQSVLASGITDPGKILSTLQSQGYTDISSKDISDAISNLSPDATDIYATQKTAAENGAPPDVLAAIGKAQNKSDALAAAGIYNTSLISDLQKSAKENGAPQSVIDAIGKATNSTDAFNAAGDYTQTATGDVALYLQYKRDALSSGQAPSDFTTWDSAYQKQQDQEKVSTAYGTAFATESGKAAADAKYSGSEATSPVIASTGAASGLTFNAPASIAPYVSFSANGVKYADLSNFAGTPTEKNQAVQAAQAAGYKVITNKNTALDVQNITDATQKLSDMKAAFDGVSQDSAATRDSYGAALTWAAGQLQTNPDVVGTNVYQDAALDILKAMSGVQGFRGGASMVHTVQTTFPQVTNTNDVNDKLISNLEQMIGDRETALVGKPSAADSLLIQENNADPIVQKGLQSIKTSNPSLYQAASTMYTSINPDTGQPYSAADIIQAFPELNQ